MCVCDDCFLYSACDDDCFLCSVFVCVGQLLPLFSVCVCVTTVSFILCVMMTVSFVLCLCDDDCFLCSVCDDDCFLYSVCDDTISFILCVMILFPLFCV